MKKLAICGDSWFTSDLSYPGKSFGEVLANNYGYNLLSLARGGCSNFAINLQVKKAIELNSDVVIVGATTPDRIEIPIISSNLSLWENLKKSFDWQSWFNSQPNCYDIERGLSNIKYFAEYDLSGKHDFLKEPTIISESLNNLAFWHREYEKQKIITEEQIESLKLYMLNLYDVEIKRQYDIWAINDACRQLTEKNIPFLLFIDHLFPNHLVYADAIAAEHKWIPKLNKIEIEDFTLFSYDPEQSARFHYSTESSKKIADYFQSRIEKLL
jgi:hypothetical protein